MPNHHLRKLINKTTNQRALLFISSAGLLLLLLVTFTLPFNKGIFSQLFNRPNSHAAGPTVSQYDVFELTLSYPTTSMTNPWEDATVTANFTTPSGKNITQKGFYYDVDTYKVRVPVEELGTYNYTVNISGPTSFTPQAGSFTSIVGSKKGFLHAMANNPYRLGFSDGSMFNFLGLNDCFGYGGYQTIDTKNYISSGDAVSLDTYFSTYQAAGFNFLRYGPNNCSFNLFSQISNTNGNFYNLNEGKAADQLFQTAVAHNFHIMMDFFAWNAPYSDAASNPSEAAAIERYMDYIMARYGAYVDIWELNNETSMPLDWLQFFTNYVHQNDPYNRIVTNSWNSTGDWNYLGAEDFHWYQTESELDSDQATANNINGGKFANGSTGIKIPVIFGEQGNGTCNWDSTSALRMRERLWSAFFNEGEIVFWNSSYAQNYCNGAANIYLGPQERGYTTVLQNFTNNTDPTVKITTVTQSNSSNIRAWGLSGLAEFLVYLQHYTDHTNNVSTSLTLNLPSAGTATWIDPATGNTLSTTSVGAGVQNITSPSFVIDAALKITYSNPLSPTPTPTPTVTASPTPIPTQTPSPTPVATPSMSNMSRTSTGKVFFDDFSRSSVGSGYTPTGVNTGNWSDNGSRLVYSSSGGGQAYETVNNISVPVNGISEFIFNSSSFISVTPRLQVSFGGINYYFDSNFNSGTVNLMKGSTSIGSGSFTFSPSTDYDIKMQVGGQIDKLWINNQLVASGTDSSPATGTGTLSIWTADFSGGVTVQYDNLAVYTSNILTVNGSLGSWELLGNWGTSIGSCNRTNSVDYSSVTAFPPDYGNGAEVHINVWTNSTCSGTQTGYYTSASGYEVMGGDVFSYTGQAPTPTPTPTLSPTPRPTSTSTPNPTSVPMPGDLNGDGVVNLTDLSWLSTDYGKNTLKGDVLTHPQSDINQDGKVDLTDLSLLAANYQ